MRLPTLFRLPRLRVFLATAALVVAVPVQAIGSFSASVFKFTKILGDDGQNGRPGGWQEATATLRFVDSRPDPARFWTCRLAISMPLRTAVLGNISADAAAELTADVATEASEVVMHSRPDWLTAEFCIAFQAEMQRIFNEDHKGLGARVNLR